MLEVQKGNKNFYIGDSENKPLALMSYVFSGDDLITVDKTEVSKELGGQGAGKLLLKELVAWARKENYKIMPRCPFAKAQMEKNEEYQDMIYKK